MKTKLSLLSSLVLLLTTSGCFAVGWYNVDVSRQGRLAMVAGGESVTVIDRQSGLVLFVPVPTSCHWVRWSPDERFIYCATESDTDEDPKILRVAPTSGSTPEVLLSTPGLVETLEVSPDGRFLSFAAIKDEGKPSTLTLFDIDARQTKELLKGVGWFHAWSPDGKRIAALRSNNPEREDEELGLGEIVLVYPETGEVKPLLGVFYMPWTSFDWTPDGNGLLLTTHTPEMPLVGGGKGWEAPLPAAVHLLEEDQPRPRKLLEIPAGKTDSSLGIWNLAFSPDGRHFLYTIAREQEDEKAEVWVAKADGSESRPMTREANLWCGTFWADDASVGWFQEEPGALIISSLDGTRRVDLMPSMSRLQELIEEAAEKGEFKEAREFPLEAPGEGKAPIPAELKSATGS